MRRLELVGLAVGILSVIAVMSPPAFAVNLPDVSVTLSGGEYPIQLQATSSAKTFVGTASGALLKGKGMTLLLVSTELSALGSFTADLTAVEEPKEKAKCHSSGDAEGVVLLTGEYHVVPLEASGSTLGVLYLVSEREIICSSGVSPIIRGDTLSSLEGIGSEATELTSVSAKLEGSEAGTPDITGYFNDGGTKVTTKLEAEAGAGFVKADEDVEGPLELSVCSSQIVVITHR